MLASILTVLPLQREVPKGADSGHSLSFSLVVISNFLKVNMVSLLQ